MRQVMIISQRIFTATVDCEPIERFLFDELIDNHRRTFPIYVFGFPFQCWSFRFGQRSIGSAAPRSDNAVSLVRTVTATVECEPTE